ncbi:PEP-CTERM sorting domain-containing protein [Pelomonas sp. Root1237]|uniref:PEP-CTERM sorting domain-containing protein n=1 Tax=Pelomonas sp. Root1237 TaxID=1736434 RepID=UPI0009E83F28|nr:PEP-CTERM sorting domain-containing protein [Pelomonas sp. Root1237]
MPDTGARHIAAASFIDDVTLTTAAVPEPTPSALLLAGTAALGGVTWQRRRR